MTPEQVDALPVMDLASGELRARLTRAVITGVKTMTTSLHRSYLAEAEPLPTPGLQRLLGVEEESLGVVEVVEVALVPLGEISQEVARGEGEGYASVAAWRASHEEFWRSTGEVADGGTQGPGLGDDELIVVERFRWLPEHSLVPAPRPRRVGIVVTDDYSKAPDRDTDPLIAALQRCEIAAEPVIWHRWEPGPEFDLLVIRTPWDYSSRTQEFLSWLERAEAQLPVLNSPELIRWNLDKVYLRELEAEGLAGVPTSWAEDGAALRRGLAEHGDEWVVIKPSISAGAFDTELLRADSAAARTLGERILARGLTVMLQPEIPELSQGREKALYFIDGHHTHAISKGALLARGGGLRGGTYLEDPQLVQATAAEIGFGERALAAAARRTGTETPLYARIDVVDSARYGTVLLEAELFEPALNLHRAPAAAAELARAIEGRLTQGAELPAGATSLTGRRGALS
ncbi:ASCH domain-containing protein [Nesterenkonia sp. E16_7]|uniref:ASCH domain-containing protein n=1 Tax=unclassified Nesterenkonia TaxID=2629769 RepID=UPI001A938212|nr:ASCH domain-containing protein [Nesterenkonia sp. E16_10]MBO0599556.1 ASCH domain-containing protein [Nesterenkonia sp. E16_7]